MKSKSIQLCIIENFMMIFSHAQVKLYIIYFPQRFSMSSSEIFIFLYAFHFLIWIRSFPRGVVLSLVKDWNCNFSQLFSSGTNRMIRLWKTIKYYTEYSSNNLFMVLFEFSIYTNKWSEMIFSCIKKPGRHIYVLGFILIRCYIVN